MNSYHHLGFNRLFLSENPFPGAKQVMDPVTAMLKQCCKELQSATFLNPIIFSVILIFFSVYLYKLIIKGPKHNFPPSPPKLPILGNIHQLSTQLHRSLQGLSEKYGPIILLHLGSSPTLIVSSAEIAKEIMKSHDSVFQNRPALKAADVLFCGCIDVAFCPYGEYWRQTKKICVLELLSPKSVQGFQFVREEEVAEMVEKIRCRCEDGGEVDLGEMFTTMSNNIASRSALGRKYDGEDGNESFGALSKKAMELMGTFNFQDAIPYLKFMDVVTGFDAKLKKTAEAFHALLDQVINEHQKTNNNDQQQSDKKDLVDILLHLQKGGELGINLTRESLIAILLDMFIGGTDTTATTMEWAMAELVKNPTIMKKAQEEVRRVVGHKTKVDECDIDEMEYLKCVVKETLRLHAPVMVTRESSSSVHSKLQGYDIPPKTKVLINAWAIQRDPKLWEKPEEFLPERFIDNPVDFKGNQNQFIPFGAGRRGCPGITFAVVQAEYVLASLLYWFDWKLPNGVTVEDFDMSDVFELVIRKKTPLRLVPVLH